LSDDRTLVEKLRAAEWVSGEGLAAGLGVTRAAVGKRVAALRARGFVIEARAHRGYHLRAVPDTLEPAVLGPLLRTRWAGRPLEWMARTSSTSDRAAERARAGAPQGLVVVAEAQERGRGRAGRSWFSPPGRGIYLSLLVRPTLPPVALPPLALAMGVAAREALAELGVAVDLKWPNDLLARGRKLGGILIEMASELERTSHVIVGVGLNVNLSADELPEALRASATSMSIEAGRSFARAPVAAALLGRLEDWFERFVAEGPAPAARAFREAAGAILGRQVRVRVAEGQSLLEGVAEDVGEDGSLLLRDRAGGLRRVGAGEVFL
jgi:BirA family biotin operon repressor/biotin-[acetyl-CoA-carboxylase] ligase